MKTTYSTVPGEERRLYPQANQLQSCNRLSQAWNAQLHFATTQKLMRSTLSLLLIRVKGNLNLPISIFQCKFQVSLYFRLQGKSRKECTKSLLKILAKWMRWLIKVFEINSIKWKKLQRKTKYYSEKLEKTKNNLKVSWKIINEVMNK